MNKVGNRILAFFLFRGIYLMRPLQTPVPSHSVAAGLRTEVGGPQKRRLDFILQQLHEP